MAFSILPGRPTAVRIERLGTNTWMTRGTGNWNPVAASPTLHLAKREGKDFVYVSEVGSGFNRKSSNGNPQDYSL